MKKFSTWLKKKDTAKRYYLIERVFCRGMKDDIDKTIKEYIKEEILKGKEITTKGFDCYKFKEENKTWFDINEIFSEKELLRNIKECVQKR